MTDVPPPGLHPSNASRYRLHIAHPSLFESGSPVASLRVNRFRACTASDQMVASQRIQPEFTRRATSVVAVDADIARTAFTLIETRVIGARKNTPSASRSKFPWVTSDKAQLRPQSSALRLASHVSAALPPCRDRVGSWLGSLGRRSVPHRDNA